MLKEGREKWVEIRKNDKKTTLLDEHVKLKTAEIHLDFGCLSFKI